MMNKKAELQDRGWAAVTAIPVGGEDKDGKMGRGHQVEGKQEAWLKAVGVTRRFQPGAKNQIFKIDH